MARQLLAKRFLLALLPLFALLAVGQLVQERALDTALLHAAIWAPITSAVYVIALRYRRCKACPDETPRPAA
ncbi:MAG: hypothetical protein M3Q96_00770 [Pseudomonadota bacterium]|nr:hypothetical protein [Pseudomonadota bacterium]MDQ3229989.1 hypothetical protein [Pseudomonadota bacterium]